MSLLPFLGSAQNWELKKEGSGIKVYTKEVASSDLDAFKAISTLNVSIEAIVKCLKDADKFCEWMPNCEMAELLKLNGLNQYHYLETNTPFPLDNRDCYYHFEYQTTSNGIKVIIKGLPSYKPVKNGLVRIPSVEGFWLLEKLGPNKTRITYQLQADPGGSIPSWIANMGSIDLPFDTLKNLQAHLEK